MSDLRSVPQIAPTRKVQVNSSELNPLNSSLPIKPTHNQFRSNIAGGAGRSIAARKAKGGVSRNARRKSPDSIKSSATT